MADPVVTNTAADTDGKTLLFAQNGVPMSTVFIDADPTSPPLNTSWFRINTGPPDSLVLGVKYSGGVLYFDLGTINT